MKVVDSIIDRIDQLLVPWLRRWSVVLLRTSLGVTTGDVVPGGMV